MKFAALALLALLAASAPTPAPGRGGTTHGISNAALIAAAKAAQLKRVDPEDDYCDGETPIAEWLARLTGRETRGVVWTAGTCELVNDLNPLDSGGRFCVQATLTLKHPRTKFDTPEIEISLEDARAGRPGAAYAFRAMFDSSEGSDYIRFRRDFEAEWRERFKDAPAPKCTEQ